MIFVPQKCTCYISFGTKPNWTKRVNVLRFCGGQTMARSPSPHQKIDKECSAKNAKNAEHPVEPVANTSSVKIADSKKRATWQI